MQLYTNSVQDRYGNALKGAQITVRSAAGALAPLFADNGVTPTANPLSADASGEFRFYAANGRYTFTVSAQGLQSETVDAFEMQDALELRASLTADAGAAIQVVKTAIDNRYRGALAADPATRTDGSANVVGDEYFSTAANLLKRWNGATWQASDINTANLAATNGSSLVGYDGGTVQAVLDDIKPLANYTALRAYTGRATGVRITAIGVAGRFVRDDADITNTDNGGTIIIDGAGRRWARDYAVDIHARWFGTDGAAIQAAINAAKYSKSVLVGPGIWNVTAPILFPTTSDFWGISVRGAKPSQMYEQLAISAATVLKATASIAVVIGNRATWAGVAGYYNSVSNLVIDGNGLGNYGYINGQQDTLRDVHVTGCVTAGVINGALTNATKMIDVSITLNLRHGLILTGGGSMPVQTSTGTILTNCRIRQNASRGVIICQTFGTKFDNCIFESNVGEGVAVDFSTTGEEYRSPLPFVGLVTFSHSYWENNQAIFRGGSAGARVTDFEFDRCNFTGKNSGSDIYLGNFIGGKFKNCRFTNVGGIYMDAEASYVEIEALATDVLPPLLGPLAGNVGITRRVSDGGTAYSKNQYGQACGFQYIKNVTATLLRDEVCGTVITNTGQAAVNVVLTVPGAELVIDVNLKKISTDFVFLAATQQATNRFEFSAEAGTSFMFKGAQRTKVFVASLELGMSLRFTFAMLNGAPYWLVQEVYGTWSAS